MWPQSQQWTHYRNLIKTVQHNSFGMADGHTQLSLDLVGSLWHSLRKKAWRKLKLLAVGVESVYSNNCFENEAILRTIWNAFHPSIWWYRNIFSQLYLNLKWSFIVRTVICISPHIDVCYIAWFVFMTLQRCLRNHTNIRTRWRLSSCLMKNTFSCGNKGE